MERDKSADFDETATVNMIVYEVVTARSLTKWAEAEAPSTPRSTPRFAGYLWMGRLRRFDGGKSDCRAGRFSRVSLKVRTPSRLLRAVLVR